MSYTEILDTHYGKMLVNKNDINQRNALVETGKSIDHAEIELLETLIGSDDVFLDVGANFGCFSLALASRAKTVFAFEPQRIIYNMLCGSIALNAFENVYAYNLAVGKQQGYINVPKFDYSKELNFGSIEFGDRQIEQLTQTRQNSTEHAGITMIDAFGLSPKLIKIDVEGMELDVLEGAKETIKRCKPICFVEIIKSNMGEIRRFFEAHDYDCEIVGGNYLCKPRQV